MIEKLEPRRLLAVSLNTRGTLIITGTGGDDVFVLSAQDKQQVDPGGGIITLPHIIVKRKGTIEGDVLMNKVKRIVVELRGGNDSFTGILTSGKKLIIDACAGNDSIVCGAGNDTVTAGNGNDTVVGNDGNDSLDGGEGNDVLTGGAGDDAMISQAGSDALEGDDGSDTADFSARTAALNITLDDAANDGESGQTGNVASDIDTILSGAGEDLIDASFILLDTTTGDAQDESLVGNGGKDTIIGGDGDDVLEGVSSNDSLSGGPGADTLDGGNGRDHLDGGAGDDYFNSGDDSLRDTLTGGTGSNTGFFDFMDRVKGVISVV